MYNHKSTNLPIPRSQDPTQDISMHRSKRVVSPDSILCVPNDIREEQTSAVDAVVKSSSHVETPQDAKRFKACHPNSFNVENGQSFNCLQHPETVNQFYPLLYTHSNFHPYYPHHANHRYEATSSLPSYQYMIGHNPSSYSHIEQNMLPDVENKNHIRRDTSLGALCLKFLDEYEKLEEGTLNVSTEKLSSPVKAPEISIDITSASLNVGRRRIYDIVNILESIGIVSRKCKNTYNWHGRDGIEETFRMLQIEAVATYPEDAVQCGLLESVEDAKSIRVKHIESVQKEGAEKLPTNGLELLLASAEHMEDIEFTAKKHDYDHSKQSRKTSSKENSLGMISQQFIQMFLLGNDTVELSATCEKIFEKDEDLSDADYKRMIKTKIRRMYDIANVMTSLGFVRKAINKTKKSAFHWCYFKSAKELWSEQKFQMS